MSFIFSEKYDSLDDFGAIVWVFQFDKSFVNKIGFRGSLFSIYREWRWNMYIICKILCIKLPHNYESFIAYIERRQPFLAVGQKQQKCDSYEDVLGVHFKIFLII